jgi:hypothetical protein
MREKNILLMELNDIYIWNRNKSEYCYIHIIRYKSQEGTSNAWEGKIKKISNMIKNMGVAVN